TMSMPASSCSLMARRVASSFAAASSSPVSRHGAHSLLGSASHDGFGRLPAMLVGDMVALSVRGGGGGGDSGEEIVGSRSPGDRSFATRYSLFATRHSLPRQP